MRCLACGSETAPGAKFCAACGKPVAPEPQHPPVHVHVNVNMGHPGAPQAGSQQMMQQALQHMPSAAMQPFAQGWGGAVAVRGRFCPHCEQRTVPVPYFSRGTNIAKMVVLFPFTSFVGPLILFLVRKNRVICSYCQKKLPGHAPVPLLDTFSTDGAQALMPLMGSEEERQLVGQGAGQEIALLERRSRKQRRRTWTLGLVTAAMASFGAADLVEGGGDGSVFLFGISALTGAGAFVNRQRGEKNSIQAEALRQRQRVQEILGIARAHGGKLNVTLVASQMHLDFREAEALLDSMVDGRRVDIQVDDQGRMNYVFPELTP